VNLAQYWRLLARYLAPLRGQVALLSLLMALAIGTQLLSPQVLRFFIDTSQASGQQRPLLIAAALFIAIGVAQRAALIGSLYVGERLGWLATNQLRADLAAHCLSLDMAFHKRRTPGELIERIDGDVTALANFFSQLVVIIGSNALLISGILLITFSEDWRVGLGMLGYTGLVLFALSRVQRLATSRWADYRERSSQMLSFIEERIGAAEDLRSSGAEAHTLAQLDGLMGRLMRSARAARLLSNVTFTISNFLTYTGYALGLAVGALLYSRGEVSIGSAFMLVYYIGMLAGPLDGIRGQIQDLQQAGASIERVSELFALRPSVTEQVRASLPSGPLAVELAGVSFRYDDEGENDQVTRWQGDTVNLENAPGVLLENVTGSPSHRVTGPPALVLDQVSLSLAPGRVLGLLGRTGSGKTTLTRLLFRLYDPTLGSVRLGGAALPDLALADLRARVGMVTQEVQLFQASLRENLTLFDETVDDGRIWAALAELGLDGWARGLPEGLDTRLSAGGAGLSAGEAQLLAFARVFLKDPGLVILDEASSRLDPASERLLERAIDRLLRGRSAIIIAHRLATVQRADEIVILEQGRVAERGARAALAAEPTSMFAGLLRSGLEEVLA
jgi:ATP-binding cassette subfamily B protein